MTKIEELKSIFLQEAKVTNIQKGYVVAEKFNIVLDTQILALLIELWGEHYKSIADEVDAVVGFPQAASPLASALALHLQIPKVLPTRKYALPGAWGNVVTYHADSFTNGVDRVPSYIGGVEPGMKILALDDVGAHGTTGIAAIQALQEAGTIVIGLGLIFDKIWQNGVEKIQKETGVPVHSLIRIQEITSEGKILLKP